MPTYSTRRVGRNPTNLITDNEMIVNEKTVTELIEGNMVATSDGLYNILRASSRQTSQLAAKVTVTSPSKLTFSVSNDFITFPGGGKNSRSVTTSRAAATGPSPILRPRNTSE